MRFNRNILNRFNSYDYCCGEVASALFFSA